MRIMPEDYNDYEKTIDIEIEGVKTWIKYYYSNITNNEQSAIDILSHELDKNLERFFYLRKQKESIRQQRKVNERNR